MLPTGHEPFATAVGRNVCLTREIRFDATLKSNHLRLLSILIEAKCARTAHVRARTYLYIVARQQYFVIQRQCPFVMSVVVGEKSVTQLYSTGRYCFSRNTDGNDNDAARSFRPGTEDFDVSQNTRHAVFFGPSFREIWLCTKITG